MSRATRTAPFMATAQAATAALVKTGECSLAGYHLFNTTTAAAYVAFYDKALAADVTVGTTTPVFFLGLPASGGATRSLPFPLKFTNGIVIAAVNAVTGNTGSTCVVELDITE